MNSSSAAAVKLSFSAAARKHLCWVVFIALASLR
jgi:hypothetical protein